LLQDLSEETARRIAQGVRAAKRPGDIAVVSIHWGGNWGYTVPQAHSQFAHQLIDAAAIDIVYGHSSHHPMGIEVYRDKPILYGCGDFLNDYEGISGYEEFRAELTLMYFLTMDPRRGKLLGLTMTPMRVQRFRENRASAPEARWLRETLNRESKQFGVGVDMRAHNHLVLQWGRRDS
jgi:poly-gamma-glutamate capsule biosynthesis protein CapA/YwtB (metallophosphatase superfamily)